MSNEQQYHPKDVQHYPLHSIIGVVPPSAISDLVAALEQAGVARSQFDIAEGSTDAERIVNATEGGFLGKLSAALAAGEEQSQRQQYVEALRAGEAVVRVRLNDDTQKGAIGELIANQGGHYINYYGRWTVESLMP